MNFGALQCKPQQPNCGVCVFNEICVAFSQKTVNQLPVKAPKLEKQRRFFNYLLLYCKGKVFIRKRIEKDIWQNLYEFPLIETKEALDFEDLQSSTLWANVLGKEPYQVQRISGWLKQTLTHRTIAARFVELTVSTHFIPPEEGWISLDPKNLTNFALPKIMELYFQEKKLFLLNL